MNTVVYDIEIFPNFFSYTDIDIKTKETNIFVLHESRDDLNKLYKYLMEPRYRIGYNNVHFDRVVCDLITDNIHKMKSFPTKTYLVHLYNKVQNMMREEQREFYKGETEIDLFLMNHFNNKSKMTSLKALQCSIFWPVVQDMPFHHTTMVTEEMIPEILEYNMNDVLSTQAFFEICKDQLTFRKELGKLNKRFMLNMPDIAIGEEIFLKAIRKEFGLSKKELRDAVQFDKTIDLNKCILPYVKFESAAFQELLNKVKWTVVSDAQKLKYNVKYKGFQYDYGVGGVHGCIEPGVYCSDDNYIIIDIDVKSYYPNLAIQNDLHPKHIPQAAFVETYKSLFEKRVEAQKAKNKTEDAGLKLALNGVFGKTGEVTSAFYDRYYFYSITLNGQLLLSMLAEKFVDNVPGLEMLQINTDGITIRIPRDKVHIVEEISEEWCKQTKLILESVEYSKMVIRDVNNYLAISMDGKVKKKGIFETEKQLHKDNSFLIVPKALEAYYVSGVPIEETVKNSKNIYDFCGRYKAYSGWSAVFNYLDKEKNKVIQENHGKMLRFFPVIKGGGTSLKVNVDGRVHSLLANQKTMKFNRYYEPENFEDYNINYEFFVTECLKIIDVVEPKQLKLF
jgi:hypothetical protein